jgi:hypothetical protein
LSHVVDPQNNLVWNSLDWVWYHNHTIIRHCSKIKNKNQFPFAIIVVNKTVKGFLKVPNWQTARPNK